MCKWARGRPRPRWLLLHWMHALLGQGRVLCWLAERDRARGRGAYAAVVGTHASRSRPRTTHATRPPAAARVQRVGVHGALMLRRFGWRARAQAGVASLPLIAAAAARLLRRPGRAGGHGAHAAAAGGQHPVRGGPGGHCGPGVQGSRCGRVLATSGAGGAALAVEGRRPPKSMGLSSMVRRRAHQLLSQASSSHSKAWARGRDAPAPTAPAQVPSEVCVVYEELRGPVPPPCSAPWAPSHPLPQPAQGRPWRRAAALSCRTSKQRWRALTCRPCPWRCRASGDGCVSNPPT